MKPLNQQEINRGIQKFVFYFFVLIVSSLISIFLFSRTIRYDLSLLSNVSSSTENAAIMHNRLGAAATSIQTKLKVYTTEVNRGRISEELKQETQLMNEMMRNDPENASYGIYKKIYTAIPYVITIKDSIKDISYDRENLQRKYDQLIKRAF